MCAAGLICYLNHVIISSEQQCLCERSRKNRLTVSGRMLQSFNSPTAVMAIIPRGHAVWAEMMHLRGSGGSVEIYFPLRLPFSIITASCA